jgi:3-hydroxybutyryl-CoA dehydrogenase
MSFRAHRNQWAVGEAGMVFSKELGNGGVHPRIVHRIVDVSVDIVIFPACRDHAENGVTLAGFNQLWFGHYAKPNEQRSVFNDLMNCEVMTELFERICVVGSGYMGNQIALQCAAHGYQVNLYDVSEMSLQNGNDSFLRFLSRMIDDGFATADQHQSIVDRVYRTTDLTEAASGSDFVLEAITEDISVKRKVFSQLESICPEHVIFATNSSSIRVSRIESSTERTDRVLNAHFVQPIWKHPFVELMRGSETSYATIRAVESFMKSIDVLPVLVRKESTGFIFNRIWRAVKKEALKVVDQGIASVEDVDRTWMIQMETPMGPLGTMDVIGLDVIRDIEMVYFDESGDPADAPPKVLLDKIANGELGEKTGKGFYSYPNPVWQHADFLKTPTP